MAKIQYIHGMKGVAACGVMVGHVVSHFAAAYGSAHSLIDTLYSGLYFFQNNVAMFVVISGYVLGGILVATFGYILPGNIVLHSEK